MKTLIFCAILLSFLTINIQSVIADPVIVDLTAGPNSSSGTINGAIFEWYDQRSTGTGVIDPFLRVQDNTTEEGYNTDFRSNNPPKYPEFDEDKGANYNHALLFSTVPIVTIDNIEYLQILLDINQKANEGGTLLSLDVLNIYESNTNLLHGYVDGILGGEEPVYSFNSGDYVKLEADWNSGSGQGDMFAYIPTSLFNFDDNIYMYLYSEFGLHNASNAGFEEWAVLKSEPQPPVVPVPGAILLGVLGLTVAGIKLRKFA